VIDPLDIPRAEATRPAGPIAVLANPLAGKGRHRGLLPAILDRLRGGDHEVRPLTAGSAAEAEAACRDAVAGGAAALVAVGGDGTFHLGLQAVAGTATPFGLVPAGTGNDLATELGVPADPLAAADAVVAALRTGGTRMIDLGRLTAPDGEERWFGAVLGAGFDAIVNERANAIRWPRGPRRYDVATVLELVRLRPRRYTMTLDGEPREFDAVLVAVGNTASYGGGHRICPAADPTDGLLDVVVGAPMSRVTLMRLKPRVLLGTHVADPLVTSYRARIIELAADGITTYADGERSAPLPITITCVPGALRLLQSG